MEMPEQKAPVVFTQMLRMFPNVPQNIIWIYVQRYSSDIEKCAQMLNLQNGKYSELLSSPLMDNNQHLNEYNGFVQQSDLKPSHESILDNNNLLHPVEELSLLKNDKDFTIEGLSDIQKIEYSSVNSQNLQSSPHVCETPVDSSNLSSPFIYHEPLALHINIDDDDDDSLHSWRPNLSADVLCSDFFLASPMLKNFQSYRDNVSCSNTEQNIFESQENPVFLKQKASYSVLPSPVYLSPQNDRASVIDIASHLHSQKSLINAIKFEVIKAKIELNDLKEIEEKLDLELKEKMQSKSIQDIEQLHKEIEQLRLECQCLCSEVSSINDDVLLGEIDEQYYENKSLSNRDIQNNLNDHTVQSQNENSSSVERESDKWQCSKCTYLNHPAMKICEMCHISKPSVRTPLYVPTTASTSCYCHPKEETLPAQS